MNKYKETFGVDISKDVFDCYGSVSGHTQFSNNETGFKTFLKSLPKESLVVMEATGYYHYRLAQFLYKKRYCCLCSEPFISKTFYPNETGENKDR